jgi:hypothetical protein
MPLFEMPPFEKSMAAVQNGPQLMPMGGGVRIGKTVKMKPR